jgi:hypothetical protein
MSDENIDDLDDDLQELLDQLDSADSDDDAIEQMIDEVEDEIEDLEDKVEELEEPEDDEVSLSVVAPDDEEVLRPTDFREVEIITNSTPEMLDEPTPPSVDVMKYHDKLDQVTTEVLSACRADRQEAQDVIDLLRLQIDDAVNKTQAPARMWVDGLVKAVEVKAGINATAVKIIEANAKMLAATKAGVNILNQNIQSGTEDLEDVLSRPLTENDEF